MIQKISIQLVNQLVVKSQQTVDKDQIEVYVYGMECFLNTGITTLLLFIWGLFSHNFAEEIVWIITFSILRKYAGGYHSPSQITCILGSAILGISNSFALTILFWNRSVIFVIYFSLFLLFLFCVPVVSPMKPLSDGARETHKTIAIILLIVFFLLYFIFPNRYGQTIAYSNTLVGVLVIFELLNIRSNEF